MINLLQAIQSVGFDYGMTPREVGDELIAGTQILWQREIKLEVTPTGSTPTRVAPSVQRSETINRRKSLPWGESNDG